MRRSAHQRREKGENHMSYLDQFEKALQERLMGLDEEEQMEIIKFVKAKILESYRNGMKAVADGRVKLRRVDDSRPENKKK